MSNIKPFIQDRLQVDYSELVASDYRLSTLVYTKYFANENLSMAFKFKANFNYLAYDWRI